MGEVVRVEQIPDGEFGIAVRLLRVENLAGGARSNTLSAFQAFARAESAPAVLARDDAKSSRRA